MKCQQCGNEVTEGADFCGKCGSKIVGTPEVNDAGLKHCPHCGKEISSGAVFCGKCGGTINPSGNSNNPSKKRDMSLIVLTAVLIVTIFGSACIIGYLYDQSGSDDIPSASSVEKHDSSKKKKSWEEKEDKKDKENEEEQESAEELQSEDGEVYLFPSDREYITISDLYDKSREEVALIRNEIYARRGYIFSTEPFKSYFEAKDWYIPDPSFTDSVFNEIEKTNKDFLVNYEKEKGWR